jgi:hypothetical protein
LTDAATTASAIPCVTSAFPRPSSEEMEPRPRPKVSEAKACPCVARIREPVRDGVAPSG